MGLASSPERVEGGQDCAEGDERPPHAKQQAADGSARADEPRGASEAATRSTGAETDVDIGAPARSGRRRGERRDRTGRRVDDPPLEGRRGDRPGPDWGLGASRAEGTRATRPAPRFVRERSERDSGAGARPSARRREDQETGDEAGRQKDEGAAPLGAVRGERDEGQSGRRAAGEAHPAPRAGRDIERAFRGRAQEDRTLRTPPAKGHVRRGDEAMEAEEQERAKRRGRRAARASGARASGAPGGSAHGTGSDKVRQEREADRTRTPARLRRWSSFPATARPTASSSSSPCRWS